MPTDLTVIDYDTVESLEQLNALLLERYQTRPRRERRGQSRDLARENPIAPKRAQYGAVGRWLNRPRPMIGRVQMPGATPTSGQARVNAKRNARAEFWRTVKVHVHPDVEAPFRQHLHLLGNGTRIHGRRALDWILLVELDVHIPGAPAGAVKAEPVYGSHWNGRASVPFLRHIDWYNADGHRIDPLVDEVQRLTAEHFPYVRAADEVPAE